MDWSPASAGRRLAFALREGVVRMPSDELRGRPLRPPSRSAFAFRGLAVVSISCRQRNRDRRRSPSRTRLACSSFVAGRRVFPVVAYNLELFDGRFHGRARGPGGVGAFSPSGLRTCSAPNIGRGCLAALPPTPSPLSWGAAEAAFPDDRSGSFRRTTCTRSEGTAAASTTAHDARGSTAMRLRRAVSVAEGARCLPRFLIAAALLPCSAAG